MNVTETFKKWFKKHWRWLALIMLAITFFISTSSFNYITQDKDYVKWASPDETANYIFSKVYGQTGEMTIFEEYNLRVEDIMHPRSFRSDYGNLKPVSFLGIILIYGWIVSLTSYKILPFLTPAVAALGIIFFYLLIKKIFGRRNALISSFLLASFPVYIYYSARSMFHNVLFVVLLIMGLYYSISMVKKSRETPNKVPRALRGLSEPSRYWFYPALAGGFIGLAIITRTSELLWLAPMLIIIWLFNIRKVGIIKLAIFVSFLFLAMLPMFSWNQILYDSPLRGGYPEMNKSIINITEASTDLVKSTAVGELAYHKALLEKIKDSIFYFGLDVRQSLKMFYYYFVDMFAWLFWPALLGLFLFLQGFYKWRKKHLVYFLSFSVISLILIFYYGSWEFHDNPDPNSFTIGNSYTRYWLPIYLGALPLVSMFIIRFTKALFPKYDANLPASRCLPRSKAGGQGGRMNANPLIANNSTLKLIRRYAKWPRKKFLINSSRVVLIALVYFLSIPFVIYGPEEGLYYSLDKTRVARQEWERVLNLTESKAVIITRYHDKLFFPERKVIVGLFDDGNMNAKYAELVKYMPTYYYNFTFPQKDLDYLNKRKLAEVGLQIKKVEQVTEDFTLYKLEKR